MKILAFGASTSATSINRQLANHAASLVPNAEVRELDLREYELPLYSQTDEEANGIPKDAHAFLAAIRESEGIVLSLAEHNGSYAAAFKNLYDWTSRLEQKLWSERRMLLLGTSPGGRGAASVLAAAEATFPRMGADLRATFSLPSFHENFSEAEGIRDAELARDLLAKIALFAE